MNEFHEVRREGTRFWAWGLVLLVLSVIVLSGLGYVGLFTSTAVERKVFEESYQYQEARSAEVATYEAQLAELEAQLLNPNLDEGDKANIGAQMAAIRIRLRTARNRQR